MLSSYIETIEGLVERVTFHNEENGFCVLRILVKGHKDLVTVVGHLPSVSSGEYIQASGQWIHDKQHGSQFKAQTLIATLPTTLEGIEKYLGSGMIKGIGPVYAKKLVQAFKENVFDIIETEFHRIREISGIGPLRVERIINGWAEQKIIREIMVFLHSYGVSTSRAVRIYKTYGDNAVSVITHNPYQLAKDIRGIGFVTADKIAEKLGIEKTSLLRARAGITYTLTKIMNDGHCGFPIDDLLTLCKELLDIPINIIQEALKLELYDKQLIKDVINEIECIFLPSLYYAEKGIADKILKLSQGQPPWPTINFTAAVEWVQKQNNIILSNGQQEAIHTALSSKIVIITGGPGVGKTTLVNSLIKILEVKQMKILLCAPTGRAAKRLTESTMQEAKTIHRLLEISPSNGEFTKNEDSPLKCDVLIVDETSMVDVPLMYALVKAVPSNAALFLVGDDDQLPSVGPGNVLGSLIQSNKIHVIELTEIFRQAVASQIITTAHNINRGIMPALAFEQNSDFYFIETEEPDLALQNIIKLILLRIPQKFKVSAVYDIQVLCPMTRGILGTRNLNVELQKALNAPNNYSIQRFGYSFSVGDKVMQVENNYEKEVYNGDIGFIKSINVIDSEITITFDQRDVIYEMGELDEIVLAYATTIHKAQGSEYPVVIIPLTMQHYPMLQRNLIYTGITRGKKLVIIVGQKKALYLAIKNKKSKNRWSMLKQNMVSRDIKS